MKISELKQISSDARIKHFLHYFWDFAIPGIASDTPILIYRRELLKIPDNSSLDEVCSVIQQVYENHIEYIKECDQNLFASQRRYISELLRRALGKKYSRKPKVTFYKAKEKRRVETILLSEKALQMEFLYTILDFNRKYRGTHLDIVHLISQSEELADEVIERRDELISNPAVFYTICEDNLLRYIKTNQWKIEYYKIMCAASSVVFHDSRYWIDKNGIDRELVNYQNNRNS